MSDTTYTKPALNQPRVFTLLMPLFFLLSVPASPAWAAAGTASDTFAAIAYNGSDGSTLPWASDWQEFGESTTAPIQSTGQVRVVAPSSTGSGTSAVTNCVATNCLRIGGNQVEIQNHGVQRQIDLSGASAATLSFTYRRVRPSSSLTQGLGMVRAEISKDGGATWQTLASYPFTTASDPSRISASFTITGSASAITKVRFIALATDNLGNPTTNTTYVENSVGYLYVDNVKIDVVKPDSPPPLPSTGLSVSDSFATVAYTGSDGVAPNTNPGPWTTPWVETGETGTSAGTSAGQVRVVTNTNCAGTSCLRIGANGPVNIANRGVSRAVNLSGNILSANLSFVYKRVINTPPTGSGSVLVQASQNGSNWTTLTTISFGAASDFSPISAYFDIKPYAVPGTQIRFLGQGTTANGMLFVDNVKVAWTVANQPPVFSPTSYSFTVNQTAAVGSVVGSVSATDPEKGPLTYAITAGNTGNAFAINASTGAITVAGPLKVGTFNLTVSAKDSVGEAATPPATVTITVVEVSVNLKLLIIGTSPASTEPLNKDGPQWPASVTSPDAALGYIQRFVEQAGVPYDVMDSSATGRAPLTLSDLTVSASQGRYNGILLTQADLAGHFASSEWTVLHSYERDFKVREAVLSGWPGYWCPTSTTFADCYYDYGMDVNTPIGSATFQGQWNTTVLGTDTAPTPLGKQLFAYVKKANIFPLTDWAAAFSPRNGVNDGSPTVTPLLTDQASGKTMVSQIGYPDGRQTLLSTISNAWFLLHSEVLAREFVNFATHGVFIGESKAYLNLHVDDLFLGDNLWDPVANWTSADVVQRLTGAEIPNVVTAQQNFRTAHPLAQEVKLEFAFNGVGTGIDKPSVAAAQDPACTALITATGLSTADSVAVLTDPATNYKDQFAYINHSYTHLDMDFSRNSLAAGPGAGTSTETDYQGEINCNRLVWQNLGLPGYDQSLNTMVTGEHSGIKDDGYHNEATNLYCYADSYLGSHCVDELAAPFPEPPLNVLLNDATKAFPYSGNPRFFQTVTTLTQPLRYLASDASQVNQAVEQFVRNVPSDRNNPLSSTPLNFDLLLLPRYPTNVFYNVWYPGAVVACSTGSTDLNCQPGSMVDEYNNLLRERPLGLNGGVDYCTAGGIAQPPYQGDICQTRDYPTILAAEADTAVRHMLSWQKYPHFFHEINLKNYDGAGNTLLFDWANAAMKLYEGYMNLPVKSLPYWKVGQLTEERLKARDAGIIGVWNVTAGTVTLQATSAAKAIVTGVGVPAGKTPEAPYGGQSIQTIDVGTVPVTVPVSVP